jgi:hypothetical protein
MLEASIGGNSRTTLVFTITPDRLAKAETISTLNFAANCKMVKTNSTMNLSVGFGIDRAALEGQVSRLVEENKSLITQLNV